MFSKEGAQVEDIENTVHTAIFKMRNQQGLTVSHRGLCSMLCGSLDRRGVHRGVDTYKSVAESLCDPHETHNGVNSLFSNIK